MAYNSLNLVAREVLHKAAGNRCHRAYCWAIICKGIGNIYNGAKICSMLDSYPPCLYVEAPGRGLPVVEDDTLLRRV